MIKNVAITLIYTAWDTNANSGAGGPSTEVATNHTIRFIRDGTSATPTNAPSRVDPVNCPGQYSIALLASEANVDSLSVCGISSTPGVVIIPLNLTTEHGVLPTIPQGNNGAVLTSGTNIGPMTLTATGTNQTALTITGIGAAHGVVINSGSGSGGDALRLICNATSGNGLLASANGSGSGAIFEGGGVTGNGLAIIGFANPSGNGGGALFIAGGGTSHNGSTAGDAVTIAGGDTLSVSVSGTVGRGLVISSGQPGSHGTGANALVAAGTGGGSGASFTGGTTGNGASFTGGASGGAGINVNSPAGDGIDVTGSNYGVNITGNGFTGLNIFGNQIGFSAGGTLAGAQFSSTGGDGIQIQPIGGHGINIAANGTNKNAILMTTTAGDAVAVTPTGGHGFNIAPVSGNKHGILSTGAGTGDGAHFVSGAGATGNGVTGISQATNGNGMQLTGNGSGVGLAASISGAITGNITGNLSGSVGSVTGNVGGNVVGSVGSVVGNVGGNVVGNVNGNVLGTVAAVAGSVASVTGNVGGNVVGSVGSVVGNVGGNLVGNVNGNVVGSVGSVVAAVTVGTNNDKTGYALSSAGNNSAASALLNFSNAIDGTWTPAQAWQIIVSSQGGILSGVGGGTIHIRNTQNTKDVIVGSVDGNGNRTAVTLNP